MRVRAGTGLAGFGILWGIASTAAQSPGKYAGNCTDAGCHGDYTKQKVVHSPVEQGACDSCHEAQAGGEHKFRLSREGGAVCTECHGEVTQDLAFVHGPVAVGACTACHDPHASPHAHLLVAEERAVCTECHSEIQERAAKPNHVHAPVADGCLGCHMPHGAKNKRMLTLEPPGLCLDCHDDIASKVTDAPVKHEAMHSEKSCLGCHDAHASREGSLLIAPGGELCLSCHGKTITSKSGAVRDFGTFLSGNPHKHSPVADGKCEACHEPHGGSRANLLAREFPTKFYSAFDAQRYALCLECHEAEAFTEKETGEATAFRDGVRNLHYLHVNQAIKGRTCQVCHNPHASKNSKQIVESVAFGSWRIPINFKETATGGSCAPGCHRLAQYNRDRSADGAPSQPATP